MATRRIDYRMQRRALLAEVRDGLKSKADVCDAHPNLVRAGEHLGDDVAKDCPICDEPDGLRHVMYVFHRRGKSAQGGRAIASKNVAAELAKHGSIRRFIVEVCLHCHWNHLIEAAHLESPARQRSRAVPRRTQG
ncbi:MAG: hypothetical protein ACI867_001320 [Glaciecola sp.]|jgi:hypothetical protein